MELILKKGYGKVVSGRVIKPYDYRIYDRFELNENEAEFWNLIEENYPNVSYSLRNMLNFQIVIARLYEFGEVIIHKWTRDRKVVKGIRRRVYHELWLKI